MNRKSSVLQIIFIGIAVILLSLLYFFYPAFKGSFYPSCPFYSITGLYCPGCGSQRSVSSLLHGNLITAMQRNLLLVVSIPFLLYSGYVFSWNVLSKNKMQQPLFYSPVFVKIVLATIIIFAILRNIPTYPFLLLAP